MLDQEEWRPIPGYTDCAVSSHGRVWRLGAEPRQLTPSTGKDGYPTVCVREGSGWQSRPVHKLVTLAFIGPRPEGMEVCHGDGDRKNNHISNLRYGTRLDNMADRDRHGTTQRGAKHWKARLSEDDVREIREALARGVRGVDLAIKFGVTQTQISGIKHRRRWAKLDAPALGDMGADLGRHAFHESS